MNDTELLPAPVDEPLPVATQPSKIVAMTPAQARVDAVAALTGVALSKAATLQLTPEETERLTAEFPDTDFLPGAAGKDNLIYIQHSALRGRLNSVLGLGQWALVVRESWNEPFVTRGTKDKPPQDGVRVYVRSMMLVRGCYVGESVGDMDYYPGNAAQNYGDAFEGAKTAAFRRCAKEFGVGVQAWDKHWCEAWWQRKRGGHAQQKPNESARETPKQAVSPRTPAPTPKALTPAERKEKLLASLKGMEAEATKVFQEEGIVMENETFHDIGLTTIERMSPDQMLALIKTVKQRRADNDQLDGAECPDEPADDGALVGTVEEVNVNTGKSKAGKPYTKYGIKIDGVWHNTFSETLYKVACAQKGERVRYAAEKTQYGHDLLSIEATGEVTP